MAAFSQERTINYMVIDDSEYCYDEEGNPDDSCPESYSEIVTLYTDDFELTISKDFYEGSVNTNVTFESHLPLQIEFDTHIMLIAGNSVIRVVGRTFERIQQRDRNIYSYNFHSKLSELQITQLRDGMLERVIFNGTTYDISEDEAQYIRDLLF